MDIEELRKNHFQVYYELMQVVPQLNAIGLSVSLHDMQSQDKAA